MAVGASEKRPIIENEKVEITEMLAVTLSVDHRAVDGVLGAKLLESPGHIGLAGRSILHIDNKNQSNPSAATPSPSTMYGNKFSAVQNDARKYHINKIGPREKRLVDNLKISNDVRKDNKIKKPELFEPRKDAKLSNVNVKA
ncbi:2-oxoacid dehydrogenase acyltransferase, catalytic domain [Cinara cedri]|uniref:2-oxoacid dehydrogenase acyltransferase, catalytic domain n=1 Tax=Cinara cedri TaxID=506608 RepID=A0A5E4NR80_9HEMI|nr:2-oxoacid dehydrogenase acyltransferase, catalytic domain [Cinara cedri]